MRMPSSHATLQINGGVAMAGQEGYNRRGSASASAANNDIAVFGNFVELLLDSRHRQVCGSRRVAVVPLRKFTNVDQYRSLIKEFFGLMRSYSSGALLE